MKLTKEDIAKICHEMNKTLCISLGDSSQPSWENAPQWQKDSAMQGVQGILSGKISRPEHSHAVWYKLKRAEGWKYGEVKDPAQKLHPCMVPYEQLPSDQRLKDHIFLQTVLHLKEFIVDDSSEGALSKDAEGAED